MRKTLNICQQKFEKKNLIQTVIIPKIVESLGMVYPELERHSKSICEIFESEDELHRAAIENNRKNFKQLKLSSTSNIKEDDTIDFSNFVLAYRNVEKQMELDARLRSLPVEFAYDKLYKTYGLNEDLIQKLAAEKRLKIDMKQFEVYKKLKKLESKSQHQIEESALMKKITSTNVPETIYHHMYDYVFDNESRTFVVSPLTAKVVIVEYNASDDSHHIVLDKTSFYHTAGGQDSDIGQITGSNGIFDVKDVTIHKGCVVHSGRFLNGAKPFESNEQVRMAVDPSHRTFLSQHHTAMHLLQAAMKKVTNRIVFQESSHVSAISLKCQFGAFGKRKINLEQLENVEQLVCNVIQSNIPIDVQHFAANELYALSNLTTVPGATYPDTGIRVLKIQDDAIAFESIEPCCGTHASNTSQLEDFCLTSLKVNNSSSYHITAVAGRLVEAIKMNGKNVRQRYETFKNKIDSDDISVDEWEALELEAGQIKGKLSDGHIPYITSARILLEMETFTKHIRTSKRAQIRKSIVSEMVDVLASRTQNNECFIVHVLETNSPLDDLLLVEAEQMCNDLPVILLNVANNRIVQGRACIPLKFTDGKFDAKIWLQELVRPFAIKCSAVKHRGRVTQSTLSEIPNQFVEPLQLEEALERTKALAVHMFSKRVSADEKNRLVKSFQLENAINDIRVKLTKVKSLDDVLGIVALVTHIRNDIKVGSYSYEMKSTCLTELAEINDRIGDVQHEIET